MSDTIKRIEKFSFYNNNAIETHLENMALMGYRLISIDRSIWTYRVIKPTPIKFRVTYFEEPLYIFYENPYIKRTEEEFYEYCKNVGWVLSGQWGQMQIFSTATHEYHEIETDFPKELIALKSVMMKKAIPGTIAMSGLAVVQAFYQYVQYVNYPIKSISSPTFVLLSLIWFVLFLAGVVAVAGYFSWLSKAEKTIKKNNKYPVDPDIKYHISMGLVFIVILIFIAQALILAFKFTSSFAFFFISQIMLAFIFARRMRFKPRNDSDDNDNDTNNENLNAIESDRKVHSIITKWLSITLLITFVLNGIITLDWLSLEPTPDTHTIELYGGYTLTYNLTQDAIPLKIQDLVSTDYAYYGYEYNVQESIFAKYSSGKQYSFDINAPEFYYEIVSFNNNYFYDDCLNYYLDLYSIRKDIDISVHQTDDPAWNANKVYQVFDKSTPLGIYIACYDEKIIFYNGFSTLTSQQAEIVFEKLRYS